MQISQKVMWEVGRTEEFPLIKDTASLPNTPPLREPSSWKYPVLEAAASPNAQWRSPVERASVWRMEEDTGTIRDKPVEGQLIGVKGGTDLRRQGAIKDNATADSRNSDEASLSWQAGMNLSRQERSPDGLRWEETGEIVEGIYPKDPSARRPQDGGRVLLHNWKNSRGTKALHKVCLAGVSSEEPPENQQMVFYGNRNHLFTKDSSDVQRRRENGIEHRTEAKHLSNWSQGEKELGPRKFQTTRSSKHNSQIFSPLVLNSRDEINKSCRPLSLFTLEDSSHEGDQCWDTHRGEIHQNTISSSPSPLLARDTLQSVEKQDKNTDPNFQQSVTNSASSSATSSPAGCQLEASNVSSGIPSQWVEAQKQGKSRAALSSSGLSCGCTDRGNTPARHEDRTQRIYTSSPYASQRSFATSKSELVALPSRAELEASAGGQDVADSDSDVLSSDLNGELELEAINMLDRPRHAYLSDVADYSGGLQLAIFGGRDLMICESRPRSLSQKYRPKLFEELVGQNIVAQALSNAILKGKIAPVYLFQGSRGTGKTSAARIFAAALNCLTLGDQRPCWLCQECTALASGNSSHVKEADAASNNGIEKVKALLESTISDPSICRYKVLIVDECHMLTTETWNALLKILEEPPMNVVFILITTDPDQLPRTTVSRCQKFCFLKIKDSEIVSKLKRLANLEQMEIVPEALDLIASRSDGSLRDAETILDQLSLFGHKITLKVVHELVGSVSNEKMVRLLDLALFGDTRGTVQSARELIDSGVEPLALMTHLATLITDILADNHTNRKHEGESFHMHSFSEDKLERLRTALKILSEAEKQVRASHDRTTWLIAALVQLGPDRSFIFPSSSMGTSDTLSHVALSDVFDNEVQGNEIYASRLEREEYQQGCGNAFADSNLEEVIKRGSFYRVNRRSSGQMQSAATTRNFIPSTDVEAEIPPNHLLPLHNNELQGTPNVLKRGKPSTHSKNITEEKQNLLSPCKLDFIWRRTLEACPSLPLRHLLQYQGRLLSISISEAEAVVHLEFSHPEHKSRGERSQKSIASAFQAILGFPVELRISLASLPAEGEIPMSKFKFLEQRNKMQCLPSHKKSNSIANVNGRFPSESSILESSLHSLIGEGAFPLKNITRQEIASESFPAIPHASHLFKEEQHFEAAVSDRVSSSYWNSAPPSGSESEKNCGQNIDATVQEEEQVESIWCQNAGTFHPLMISDCGGFRGSHVLQTTVQEEDDIVESSSQKCYSHLMNGPFSGEDGQTLLGDTLTASLENKSLQRVGIIKEDPHSSSDSLPVLKPASISPDPHDMKTNIAKKMRHMTIKNRLRSLTKGERKKSCHSSQNNDPGTNGLDVESHTTGSQKKGRLIGAAESIARLFLK